MVVFELKFAWFMISTVMKPAKIAGTVAKTAGVSKKTVATVTKIHAAYETANAAYTNVQAASDFLRQGSTRFRIQQDIPGQSPETQLIWFNPRQDGHWTQARYVIGDIEGLNWVTQSYNYAGDANFTNRKDPSNGLCLWPDTIDGATCLLPRETFGANEGEATQNAVARFVSLDGRVRIWVESDPFGL